MEGRDLNPGLMVHLDIISQKRISFGGYKNCIFLQDYDTKKNGLSSQRQENNWPEKSPHLWINERVKVETSKYFPVTIQAKTRALKMIVQIFEEI